MSVSTIVVEVATEFRTDGESGLIRGRHPHLGIYGHGRTRGEVQEMLKSGFYAWAAFHREHASLENELRETGLTWFSIEEADRRGIPYESQDAPQPKLKRLGKLRTAPQVQPDDAWRNDLCYAA